MALPVAILAGGLATRLHPATNTIAKSMICVADEPFIAHQLRLLKRNGAERVVLCIGYLGQQIRDFVGDGDAFGLKVNYSSGIISPGHRRRASTCTSAPGRGVYRHLWGQLS